MNFISLFIVLKGYIFFLRPKDTDLIFVENFKKIFLVRFSLPARLPLLPPRKASIILECKISTNQAIQCKIMNWGLRQIFIITNLSSLDRVSLSEALDSLSAGRFKEPVYNMHYDFDHLKQNLWLHFFFVGYVANQQSHGRTRTKR